MELLMTGWHDEDSQEKKQFWKMTGLVICETYCLRVAWRTPIRGPTIAPVQTWSWIFSLAWIGLKKTGLEWLNLQGEVLTQGLEGGGPPSPRTAGVNLPEREKRLIMVMVKIRLMMTCVKPCLSLL